MADVFISYKRSDLDKVARVAAALQERELSVWYDASLQAGSAYDAEITRELRAAKAVLVCWSKESVESDWVRAEATEGRKRNALVCCMLEPCNPYPPFNLIHHEDISDWTGDPDHIGWRRLLAAVGAKAGRADLAVAAPPPSAGRGKSGRASPLVWAALAALVLGAGGAGAYLALRPNEPAAPAEIAQAPPTAPEAAPVTEAPSTTAPEQAPPPASASPSAETPVAPAPPKPMFRMIGSEQTFGPAARETVTVAFAPGEHKAPQGGANTFDDLARRFGAARLEGVDITAPQIRDETLAVLRDRRISTIVKGFTDRGVSPNAIAISYSPRDLAAGQTYESFELVIYSRPEE